MKLYKAISDMAQFPAWWDHTIATCVGTGIEEVTIFDYTPRTMEEVEDFQNKCHWIYLVLLNTLKTPEGKEILRRYKDSQDGRRVLYDLYMEYSTSTTADIRAGNIIEELSTIRLDHTWNKPTLEFFLYIDKLMDDYNDSVRTEAQRLTQEMRRAYVERAVSGIRVFNEIKLRERDRIATNGVGARFTYTQHMYLLREAAKSYDMERARRSRNRRSANLHDGVGSDDSDIQDGEYAMFQAWKAAMSSNTRIESDTWNSLDSETKRAWSKFSPEDKAAILKSSSDSKEERKVHFHEGSQSQEESDDKPETTEENETESATDDAQNQANVAESTSKETNRVKGKAHPGDMRRVLGKSQNARASGKAFTVNWNVNSIKTRPNKGNSGAAGTQKDLRVGGSAGSAGSSGSGSNQGGVELRRGGQPTQSGTRYQGSELEDWGVDEDSLVGGLNLQDIQDEYWGEMEDQFFG